MKKGKKAILAAGAIVAGLVGMGDTKAVLQEQAKPKIEAIEEKDKPNTEGVRVSSNYKNHPPKPFYSSLDFKRTKWGKVTVKKIW